MATNLIYNGVELHNVTTSEWQQEVLYDDSNTDLLYTKHKITVEGILHVQGPDGVVADAPAWILPVGSASRIYTIDDVLARVQALLAEPRRKLEIKISPMSVAGVTPVATTIFRCQPSGATGPHPDGGGVDEDCSNGPRPISVSIRKILSNKVFTVAFTIECCRLETGVPTGNVLPSVVLNNRWSIAETLDGNFFMTRTITGKMRLASALYSQQLYKWVVVPGLERGFRRESLEYSVSPSGLECEYTIVDKQIHWAPPWPATKMEGTHSASVGADGMTAYEDFWIRLEGSPTANKRMMFAQALAIGLTRLKLLGKDKAQFNIQYIPDNITMIEHFGDTNVIEFRARVKYTPAKTEEFIVVANNNLCEPLQPKTGGKYPGYDPKLSRVPDIFGEMDSPRSPAVSVLLGCYLQTPDGPHEIAKFADAATPDQKKTSKLPETPYVKQVPYQPDTTPAYYSADAQQAPYTHARMTIDYYTSGSNLPLPKGGSGDISAADTINSLTGTAVSGILSALGPPGLRAATTSQVKAATSAVLPLSGEQASIVVKFDFERHGALPKIPPCPATITLAKDLIGTRTWTRVSSVAPTYNGAGTAQHFRLEGEYIYALNRPIQPDENISAGALPFTTATCQSNFFSLQAVADSRMDLQGVPQNAANAVPPQQAAAAQQAVQQLPFQPLAPADDAGAAAAPAQNPVVNADVKVIPWQDPGQNAAPGGNDALPEVTASLNALAGTGDRAGMLDPPTPQEIAQQQGNPNYQAQNAAEQALIDKGYTHTDHGWVPPAQATEPGDTGAAANQDGGGADDQDQAADNQPVMPVWQLRL